MKKEKIEAFFALLTAGLWEKEVRLSQFRDIDYNELYRLAEEQSVEGIVAAGIDYVSDVNIPKEVVLKFVGCALQLEQRNLAMNAFLRDIIVKMRSVGIYTLLVKGQGVAQSYKRPLWRTSGDVDFFLSDINYEKAKNYLLSKADSHDQEWKTSKHLGMSIDGWTVEIHGSLRGSLSPQINHTLDDIKKETFYDGKVRSWLNGNTQIFLLEINNDIIYVFTHFLGHFYKGGIGLRQICDWCRLLWTYRSNLDLNLLESRIRKMGLMSEWRAFGAFAVEYLGMPSEAMPFFSANDKWKRKADKLCKFILEVGNFGHNRDMSYYQKYPYLIRKVISMARRCGDVMKHMRIFPIDSLRFFPYIMYNGIRSAVRGE